MEGRYLSLFFLIALVPGAITVEVTDQGLIPPDPIAGEVVIIYI